MPKVRVADVHRMVRLALPGPAEGSDRPDYGASAGGLRDVRVSASPRTGIVTPEAVVLAFDTAGVGSRLLAILIDLSLQLVALLAVLFAFSILGHTHVGLFGIFAGVFAIAFVYPVAVEALSRGKSLGKAVMGLRVVTVEGAPIGVRHALIRGALGLIDFWATSGGVALLAVLVTPRNQRLGDLAAGTVVLRERTGARAPAPATFQVPAGWESYAATIDVRSLDDVTYGVVRSFLLRAPTLDGRTRDALARQVATPVAARLHHTPPPGVSAEAFCACVAGLYQARNQMRPTAPPPSGLATAPASLAVEPATGLAAAPTGVAAAAAPAAGLAPPGSTIPVPAPPAPPAPGAGPASTGSGPAEPASGGRAGGFVPPA